MFSIIVSHVFIRLFNVQLYDELISYRKRVLGILFINVVIVDGMVFSCFVIFKHRKLKLKIGLK